MDSRDIKEQLPEVEPCNYLSSMYSMQKELLAGYICIEGLPEYPINVNTKKSQTLLKDFTGRVIEELAEGYEALLFVDNLTRENRFWQGDFDDSKLIECINHLQNAGEEMADAMHFMLELLIYANIQPEDIESYMDEKLRLKEFPEAMEKTVIEKAMLVGITLLDTEEINIGNNNIIDLYRAYKSLDNLQDPISKDFLCCGRMHNTQIYKRYRSQMWEVTYHLNIARNFLKNKPWKQSQMMTNETAYQEELVLSFICMMGLFFNMGIDHHNLFFLYFKKNRVNKFRQKSKY